MISADITEGLTFDDVLLIPHVLTFYHPKPILQPNSLATFDSRFHFAPQQWIRLPKLPWPSLWRNKGASVSFTKTSALNVRQKRFDKVKRSESGMIVDPVTILPTKPVREALMVRERFHISGVPVVDEDGHLVGIITNRDLRFETRFDIPVSEVMTKQPLVTVPVGTTAGASQGCAAKAIESKNYWLSTTINASRA